MPTPCHAASPGRLSARPTGRAEGSVGDWIVYLEPSKVTGSRGYFAVARVQKIVADPKAPGMYLALIEPGSYLQFVRPVPFRNVNGPLERGLLNENGKLSGRAQSAVRPISPQDFSRIVERGIDDNEKIINGGGRAEVDAAHIQPVQHHGPDIVQNGLALSGTAHWMFDRGLISLSDDLEILLSRQVNDPSSIQSLINKSGRATPPSRDADRPHPRYLQWHRENCFKS